MKESGPDNKKRAGRAAMLGLAATLAAGAPAHGQQLQNPTGGDFYDPNSGVGEGYYRGPEDGGEEYTDLGSEDYSYKPSREVLNVFGGLDQEIGSSLSITPEQIAKVHAAIDDFVAKHPAHEGKKIDENTVAESYSPWLELQEGLWWGPEKNPIIIGLAMAYIKQKAGISEAPAEQK